MSAKIEPTTDGFGTPSKRGRKPGASVSVTDGSTERAAGIVESPNGDGSAAGAIAAKPERREPERIAGFGVIDPHRAPEPANDRPKRGRKPGSGRKKEAESHPVGVVSFNFEDALKSGCLFLAMIASAPDLILDDEEAKKVADATRELQRFYPTIQVAEKTAAWCNFGLAVGTVFGPKVIATYRRERKKRPETIRPVITNAGPPATSRAMPSSSPSVFPIIDFKPNQTPEPGESDLRSPSELLGSSAPAVDEE